MVGPVRHVRASNWVRLVASQLTQFLSYYQTCNNLNRSRRKKSGECNSGFRRMSCLAHCGVRLPPNVTNLGTKMSWKPILKGIYLSYLHVSILAHFEAKSDVHALHSVSTFLPCCRRSSNIIIIIILYQNMYYYSYILESFLFKAQSIPHWYFGQESRKKSIFICIKIEVLTLT